MKILFIKNQILFPLNVGGNIRTYNILRYLAKWHDVTFLCNSYPHDADYLREMNTLNLRMETVPWTNPSSAEWQYYCGLLWNTFSKLPYSVSKVTNPRLFRRARDLLNQQNFDLLICDFVQMAAVTVCLPCHRRILFQHNVEAQILERHICASSSFLRKLVMWTQWRKMMRFEGEAGKRFDTVIAVSDQDRAHFQKSYNWDHVDVIDTAVDVDQYVPMSQDIERPQSVVFVASMDWLPNQDGATFLVKKVWPLIRARHPHATLQLVGRNPSRKLLGLQDVPGVDVIGTVPDVRPYLAKSQVVAVPLLVGGGTRIKIFEALAMGKAVVSTSIGAEGLKVTPGKHLLISDTPEAFADATCRLFEFPSERRRLGDEGRKLVNENFSAESVAKQFDRICREKTIKVN